MDFDRHPMLSKSRHIRRWKFDLERRETSRLREIDERRALQDLAIRKLHKGFDLQAQDKTAKFERPSFSVVGEKTRTEMENYQKGYALIDWSK